MNKLIAKTAALSLALTLGIKATAAQAAPVHMDWVTSWYSSPQPVWGSDFVLPTNVPLFIENQTLSETVRLSAGGKRLRLVFSNRYGREPVAVGAVQLAFLNHSASSTDKAVTFGGKRNAIVAPGAQLTSDPIAVTVKPLTRLSIKSYFPQRTAIASFHWGDQQTVDVANGDWTARSGFTPDSSIKGRLFLSGVLVETPVAARTVVTLGDSITDGNGSTPDQDRRWPDFLANCHQRM